MVAVVWADVPGPCRVSERGVRCTEGAYEVNVRTAPIEPSSTGAAHVDRFLDLFDWPRCSFDAAWLDGERGWQASCDDGERAWIGRWWVVDDAVWSQTVAGPRAGIEAAAVHWFARVGFPGKVITAPRLR